MSTNAHSPTDKNGDTPSGTTLEGIIALTSKGVGYVPHADFEEDIEIAPEDINTALHGDSVEIRLNPKRSGERRSGAVIRVTGRAKTTFIGVLKREDGEYRVVPDDRKMYTDFSVNAADLGEARPDMKVMVEMQPWSDPAAPPRAIVVRELGVPGEHETEMRAAVLGHGFDLSFPEEVEQEARELENTPAVNEEDRAKRRDFRDITTFTIDPETAKDFDDALSFKKLENGNVEVGVHIADVSHFVKEGSAIDREALERATSIYLVDRTIPMLPEILSNDLCSLRADEERLAFSAVFELDENAQVHDMWIGESVIFSDTRFTYRSAQDVLDGTASGPHHEELTTLNALAEKLRAQRERKGAIAFEQDEVQFELDERGKPVNVFTKELLPTNKLIEEFMLLANRSVAEYFYKNCKDAKGKNAAFIYRVHDEPDPEKIEQLGIFLRALGYDFETGGGSVTAIDINKLFGQVEGKPEEDLVKTATIRSMTKAIYTTKNIGHFGLAFKYYTHFTSPIRRYPDLAVHRVLKQHLDGTPISSKEFARYERIALRSSQRELAAMQAERDSIKFKQVEYMSERVGREFDATISGVTKWGIFVQEKETKAEGMVRLGSLGHDYYDFDQKNYRVAGRRTGEQFALGDDVRVKLTGADIKERQLDFEILKRKK